MIRDECNSQDGFASRKLGTWSFTNESTRNLSDTNKKDRIFIRSFFMKVFLGGSLIPLPLNFYFLTLSASPSGLFLAMSTNTGAATKMDE